MKYSNSQNFVLITEFLTLVWNLLLHAMPGIVYVSVTPSVNSHLVRSSTRSGLNEHTDANSGIVLSGLVTHNLKGVLNNYGTDSSTDRLSCICHLSPLPKLKNWQHNSTRGRLSYVNWILDVWNLPHATPVKPSMVSHQADRSVRLLLALGVWAGEVKTFFDAEWAC